MTKDNPYVRCIIYAKNGSYSSFTETVLNGYFYINTSYDKISQRFSNGYQIQSIQCSSDGSMTIGWIKSGTRELESFEEVSKEIACFYSGDALNNLTNPRSILTLFKDINDNYGLGYRPNNDYFSFYGNATTRGFNYILKRYTALKNLLPKDPNNATKTHWSIGS